MKEEAVGTLLELPAHLRTSLADALRAGLVSLDSSPTALRANLSVRGRQVDDVQRLLARWRELDITEPAAAAWLLSLDQLASTFTHPDFVWSGPEVPGLHARDTRRVYGEVIGAASRSIWASTYAFFDGPEAFKSLAERMDAQHDLAVTLLLNIDRKRGDTTAADSLVRRFVERFWEHRWPDHNGPASSMTPASRPQP